MSVSIKDLLPPARIVMVGDNKLEVHGIGLEGFAALLQNHSAALADHIKTADVDFMGLVKDSAPLAIDLIAHGADAVGQEEYIRKLPLYVQVEAVKCIWEESVPDVKKFVELLSSMVATLKTESVTPTSPPSKKP